MILQIKGMCTKLLSVLKQPQKGSPTKHGRLNPTCGLDIEKGWLCKLNAGASRNVLEKAISLLFQAAG